MQISDTKLRRHIERLWHDYVNGDYSAQRYLEALGVRLVPGQPSIDCIARVAHELGINGNIELLEVLSSSATEVSNPASFLKRGDGIAIYFAGGSSNQFMNAALYEGQGIFSSKWNLDVLVYHTLPNVPANYGNTVKLYLVDEKLRIRLQTLMMQEISGDSF